jgi:hypothetical protein
LEWFIRYRRRRALSAVSESERGIVKSKVNPSPLLLSGRSEDDMEEKGILKGIKGRKGWRMR